jgi:hypothetical protein
VVVSTARTRARALWHTGNAAGVNGLRARCVAAVLVSAVVALGCGSTSAVVPPKQTALVPVGWERAARVSPHSVRLVVVYGTGLLPVKAVLLQDTKADRIALYANRPRRHAAAGTSNVACLVVHSSRFRRGAPLGDAAPAPSPGERTASRNAQQTARYFVATRHRCYSLPLRAK